MEIFNIYPFNNNHNIFFNSDNSNSPNYKTYDREFNNTSKKDYSISFINYSQKYCIGFIDIINSTKETAKIKDPKKLRRYYSLFLNSMTSIIHDFNGKIIKNNGDNLFFYFPKTYDHKNNSAFHDALECALTMIDSHVGLNNKLIEENLPTINFRISMDYGEVEIAISTKSNDVDLFGSIVNECAKTNNTISHTGFVIGNRLYDIIKETFFTKYYTFDELKEKSNEKVNTCDRIFLITRNMENNDIYASTNFYHKEKQVQNIKAADNSNYNILLIDDDEDVLYTFEALLKREGYNVKSFSKPIDGFKQFIENNPSLYDLIILDIRMPDINGIKLYYQLKAINPYINILFITALDIVQELVDALPGIKINDIIRKPIASDRFLIKVRSMIKDYSYFKKYF